MKFARSYLRSLLIGMLGPALIAALKLGLLPWLENSSAMFLLFLAVAMAALFGGLLAGLLATVLGAVVIDYFFLMTPQHTLTLGHHMEDARLVLFRLVGLQLTWLIALGRQHRSLRRELTGRHEAEAALGYSRSFFLSLLDGAPCLLWRADAQGKCSYVNLTWRQFTGLSIEQALADGWAAILHPADREPSLQFFTAAFALRQPFECEYRIRRHDGMYRWTRALARPVFEPDGTFAGHIGINYDTTEQKDAQQSLRESEKCYRLLAEHSDDLISLQDAAGVFLYASPACAKLLGFEPEELLGRSYYDFIHPEDIPAVRRAHNMLLSSSEPCTVICRMRRKDGCYIHMEIRGRSVREPHTGEFIEFQAAFRDISQRVHADQRAAHLLEQIITAQEEERRRLARELHDGAGQSLTSMLLGLRALEESKAASVQAEIQQLRQIASHTIEDLRRMAAGLRPSTLDDLGLLPALERLIAEFAHTHNLSIDLEAGEVEGLRLPPALETALYRITQEALNNVAKHAVARCVLILLERQVASLSLSIQDDGRGFDVSTTLADLESGRHIGLSSMRERATLLGGSLRVESVPARGTTLTLQVPLLEVPTARHQEPRWRPEGARP